MADQPRRIQRSRRAGWKAPAGAVYVGRPTCWGNPYEREDFGSSELLVALYRDWIRSDARSAAVARRRLPELRGKALMCWCKPGEPCHADVLLELANAPGVASPFRCDEGPPLACAGGPSTGTSP